MNQRAAQYLPYLDGWRGLAIGFLLLGHFFPVPGINMGEVGVDLFFVLSGFLMARLLFLDEVALPLFYRRRIARIFPAVFVFLVLVLAAYAILGRTIDWRESAFAATFLNNYFPGQPGAAVMPFGHIWSLSVEEHSYIVLSLAALAVRKRLLGARAAVGLLALLSAAVGIWYWHSYTGTRLHFDRWLRSEVSSFGILVSSFLLLCFHGRQLPRMAGLAVPALAGLGLVLHWWTVPLPVATIAGVGALALAINLLRAAPPWLHALLSFAPLRRLGLWSFSIYLWQQPFYLLAARGVLAPPAALAIAIVAGIASYYLVEQPARSWLNRRWTGSRAAPAAAQGVAS
jgi:peptidoglycan/LPS O-acetylase OafA/YrhL